MNTNTIEYEALRLPLNERANLAHKLLLSLESLAAPEIEQIWLDEAERRVNEIEQGLVQLIPAAEVSRKARALFK
jgi:putative addiction module component (TIGR02574 family)